MEDISERLELLENRIEFIENEIGASVAQRHFENTVEGAFANTSASVTFRNGDYGHYARASGLEGEEVDMAVDRLQTSGLQYSVIGTSEGTGMEVWTPEEL